MGALRTVVKDAFLKGGHDKDFKPQYNLKERLHKLPYNYMPLGNGKEEKKNYRDADGAVIIEPRGFVTNPVKKGKVGPGTTIGGVIPYIPDEYDYKKKLAAKEREYHISKL